MTTHIKTACPFLMAAALTRPDINDLSFDVLNEVISCKESLCGLWLDHVHTSAGNMIRGRCALKFVAEKNADARLLV